MSGRGRRIALGVPKRFSTDHFTNPTPRHTKAFTEVLLCHPARSVEAPNLAHDTRGGSRPSGASALYGVGNWQAHNYEVVAQGTTVNPKASGQVCDGVTRAAPRDPPRIALIVGLLAPRRPSAVVLVVAPTGIDAVDRVPVGAGTHVCKEVLKAVAPSPANRDATPTVLSKPLVTWVVATRLHRNPRGIFRRASRQGFVAVGRFHGSRRLYPQATAATGITTPQAAPVNAANCPAPAPTCPSATRGDVSPDNVPAPKRLSGEIDEFSHTHSTPNIMGVCRMKGAR